MANFRDWSDWDEEIEEESEGEKMPSGLWMNWQIKMSSESNGYDNEYYGIRVSGRIRRTTKLLLSKLKAESTQCHKVNFLGRGPIAHMDAELKEMQEIASSPSAFTLFGGASGIRKCILTHQDGQSLEAKLLDI